MPPDLFLGPVDHMMECTAHRGMAGVTVGNEVFTDPDFADDVALLAEMLEVLVLPATFENAPPPPLLCECGPESQ